GVTNHVRVGKVHNEYVRLAFFNGTKKLIGKFEGRHFGHQIVSRNSWRRHQQSLLVRKLALSAAIEKVSNVRIFLSLSHAIIPHVQRCKYLRQNISWQFRRERNRQRIVLVINRETHKVHMGTIWNCKIIEAGNGKGAGDLASSIRPKIKEDN